MTALSIHIDGGAHGNPGPAAFAYVIMQDGQLLAEEAGKLGHTTNNVAEYTALVRALERALELGGKRLHIRGDSELLVKQMNGQYRVKSEQLKDLYEEACQLRRKFESVKIEHVFRSANSHADRLCNEALDGLRDVMNPSPIPKLAVKTTIYARRPWHTCGKRPRRGRRDAPMRRHRKLHGSSSRSSSKTTKVIALQGGHMTHAKPQRSLSCGFA